MLLVSHLRNMEKIFTPGYVTVIRKKDDDYTTVYVTSSKVLHGLDTNENKVREGVIARLRKDPSVVCVLENKMGYCEETFEHKGFVFTVTIREGRGCVQPSCGMQVHYNKELVYENTYEDRKDEEGFIDKTTLDELGSDIRRILQDIDMECYEDFVDEDSVNFQLAEPEQELEDMYEVALLLKENGYEYERLHTIGYVSEPCLVVHENDLVMIAEKHFSGGFFVEMKRILGTKENYRLEDILKHATEALDVETFQYKDGSWAFRKPIYYELYESNFLTKFEEAVGEIREAIRKVENHAGAYAEDVSPFKTYRDLFTYEVIDQSLALSKLMI